MKKKLQSSRVEETVLSFAEVFQTGEWVKINILIKMDSEPGAADGVEEVWINDTLEKARYDIPFRRAREGEGVGFNWISIGGNSHNVPFSKGESVRAMVCYYRL